MNPEQSSLIRNLKIVELAEGATACVAGVVAVANAVDGLIFHEGNPDLGVGFGVVSVLMGLGAALVHGRRVDLEKS